MEAEHNRAQPGCGARLLKLIVAIALVFLIAAALRGGSAQAEAARAQATAAPQPDAGGQALVIFAVAVSVVIVLAAVGGIVALLKSISIAEVRASAELEHATAERLAQQRAAFEFKPLGPYHVAIRYYDAETDTIQHTIETLDRPNWAMPDMSPVPPTMMPDDEKRRREALHLISESLKRYGETSNVILGYRDVPNMGSDTWVKVTDWLIARGFGITKGAGDGTFCGLPFPSLRRLLDALRAGAIPLPQRNGG